MRNTHSASVYALALLPMLLMLAMVAAFAGTGETVVSFYKTYRYHNPQLTYWLKVLTDWGNPFLYVIYIGIYVKAAQKSVLAASNPQLARRRRNFVIAWVIAQLLVAFLLVRIFKIAIGKPRPGVDGLYMPFSFSPGHHSMPSGHTAEIVGSMLPLTGAGRNIAGMLFALAFGCYSALVGFSRIYLGQHHLSDVFFGTLLGMFSALVMHSIWTHLNRKNNERN
ncbi:phosphatase PAP2 family protein [Oleidesulfovibrio sp.]|uniref:phosphatase PAP2 family protein n=1 Tax=Oleidesulfovibrio sp. TaxID=2909707 RepID=UPI003A857A70